MMVAAALLGGIEPPLEESAASANLYAVAIVLIELGVVIWLIALPPINREMLIDSNLVRPSFEPKWVTWCSSAFVLGFAALHLELIRD
jgi:hypothetical protein